MNYIFEINAFYEWVTLNNLNPSAQALWHALMNLNNRCAVNINGAWYWRAEFTAPNSMLLSILAFSRQQLDKMRNVLIQTGRIVYRKGKGNQSGIYKIIPFGKFSEEYVGDFPEKVWVSSDGVSIYFTQPLTQPLTQMRDSSNLYNNIINNNIINNNTTATRAKETDALSDAAFSGIVKMYEENIGTVSSITAQCITDWLKDVDASLIEYAIEEAVNYGKRNWMYIEKILKTHFSQGVKRRSDVKQRSMQKKSDKDYEIFHNDYDYDAIENKVWSKGVK